MMEVRVEHLRPRAIVRIKRGYSVKQQAWFPHLRVVTTVWRQERDKMAELPWNAPLPDTHTHSKSEALMNCLG